MKDSTKRRIAFEISYFYKQFKYKGMPFIIGSFVKFLDEDFLGIINDTVNSVFVLGLIISVPLVLVAYFERFMNWVLRWSGNNVTTIFQCKTFSLVYMFLFLLIIHFIFYIIFLSTSFIKGGDDDYSARFLCALFSTIIAFGIIIYKKRKYKNNKSQSSN